MTMNVLWMGQEDIDFPNGNPPAIALGAVSRAGYSRTCFNGNSSAVFCRSTLFPGGAVTSAWLSFRLDASLATSSKFVGFGLSGTNKGLFVGSDSTSNIKLALWTFDGTSWVKLAAETGTSILGYTRIDMQVISYGASSTVNIYANSNLALSYGPANVAVSGMTNFDSVTFTGTNTNVSYYTEIFVADSDTRNASIVTLAPMTGTATTNTFAAGTYADIDETSTNDADVAYAAAAGQEFNCLLTDMPAGSFFVRGIKVAARMANPSAPGINLEIGVRTNSSTQVGSSNTLTVPFQTFENYMAVNPVTGVAFTLTELNALQFAAVSV